MFAGAGIFADGMCNRYRCGCVIYLKADERDGVFHAESV
jgi:hypothetical protein